MITNGRPLLSPESTTQSAIWRTSPDGVTRMKTARLMLLAGDGSSTSDFAGALGGVAVVLTLDSGTASSSDATAEWGSKTSPRMTIPMWYIPIFSLPVCHAECVGYYKRSTAPVDFANRGC